jgi:hypothetical protein
MSYDSYLPKSQCVEVRQRIHDIGRIFLLHALLARISVKSLLSICQVTLEVSHGQLIGIHCNIMKSSGCG